MKPSPWVCALSVTSKDVRCLVSLDSELPSTVDAVASCGSAWLCCPSGKCGPAGVAELQSRDGEVLAPELPRGRINPDGVSPQETAEGRRRRIKRSRAVELLAEECSYAEIAQKIGFTNRGS